jgi:hypothetical protein
VVCDSVTAVPSAQSRDLSQDFRMPACEAAPGWRLDTCVQREALGSATGPDEPAPGWRTAFFRVASPRSAIAVRSAPPLDRETTAATGRVSRCGTGGRIEGTLRPRMRRFSLRGLVLRGERPHSSWNSSLSLCGPNLANRRFVDLVVVSFLVGKGSTAGSISMSDLSAPAGKKRRPAWRVFGKPLLRLICICLARAGACRRSSPRLGAARRPGSRSGRSSSRATEVSRAPSFLRDVGFIRC